MRSRKRIATVALAATCALGGAAAGISQSSAATKSSAKKGGTVKHAGAAGPGGWGHPGGPGGGPGGAVHSVAEVLNKAGTAYISVTTDSGTITSADTSAGTITLKEGTSSVTYATPTITIPSGATVTLDGKTSSLGALAEGDRVSISSSSEGTTVFATDSSFQPAGGPGGMGGPGGPPPSGSSGSGSSPSS
jgi:hypothetical protein